jgi:GDPmannose 4,6-dehydratase
VKRALVTGITGQSGSFLAELLLAKGYVVYGLIRRTSGVTTGRIEHLLRGDHPIHLVYGDMADGLSLLNAVEIAEPDEVYNLAGQSQVGVSFKMPDYTCDVVGAGPIRLLEALRTLRSKARFYQASTSELFGKVVETPQTERTPFHPRSPYAAAKAQAFYATVNYREAYGMFAVNGILYNHESERRGEEFVTRKITRAVARIHLGLQESFALGNLESKRDWGYAGDYVEGMWRMLQADTPDDYILATGQTHSVREFVDLAFGCVRISNWEKHVVRDPALVRPAEVDLLLGDASKAERELGWKPKVTFEELVRIMVEHDVEREAAAKHAAEAES